MEGADARTGLAVEVSGVNLRYKDSECDEKGKKAMKSAQHVGKAIMDWIETINLHSKSPNN